ncbi:MAG: helix-hairpin-helix domain-containing protein [Actinobacteria bacterium]|nr:helix-hairpin-helix domain-containing protein [Actinomycetota bacterium]
MREDAFETATRGSGARRSPRTGSPARYRPQVVVSLLVVVVLVGGALYTARLSEGAPRVVYTASLEEIEEASQDPLRVDINTADVEELDELPEVGPSTAESIVEYRRSNGQFRSVDELEEIPGIGPATLEKIEPFATV